jgi:hypothetical protein
LLVNEVNPLAILQFKEIPALEYQGTAQLKGRQCHLIEFQPSIANQFLEVLASDFIFQAWIDAEENVLLKTSVQAKSKGTGKGDFLINLEFFDYHEPIKISPPTKEIPKD